MELWVIKVDRLLIYVNSRFPPPRLADVGLLRLGSPIGEWNTRIISSRCFIISLDRPPEKAPIDGRDLEDLLEEQFQSRRRCANDANVRLADQPNPSPIGFPSHVIRPEVDPDGIVDPKNTTYTEPVKGQFNAIGLER